MASDAAKCQNPVRKKQVRKITREARRKFEAGSAVLPRGWVNGRASEDRDEWTEEVRDPCELCYDDQAEPPEVQAERIRRQRTSGDRRVAFQRRRVTITADKVLRARGKS